VRAVVRTGPNGLPRFLHTLRHSRLAWLAQAVPDEDPLPEITVAESGGDRWSFQRRLLANTAFDQVFTIDPARYTPLTGGTGAYEYDGDDGDTLRFGDGTRGAIPADGSSFVVTYRVGGGERGNVAPDTLTRVDAVAQATLGIAGVSNPLLATGGQDEEPAEQVRELAPYAFRAVQQRAVRAEDYDLAVERTLPWVQRAGTRFRYTGSWLSIFTAVDPHESESLPAGRAVELAELLDRYRMAGYEAYGRAPRYAPLDISIKVCARPEAFRGDVEAGVLAALHEFFQPDRFTFGVPLERSALETTVQDVPGVDGVTGLLYRRRGHTSDFVTMLDTVDVAADEIVRADNDPSRPDAGSFRVEVGGGK
jgi:predicted phage baseplate assembly protein